MTQRTPLEKYLLGVDNPTFENIVRQSTVQEMLTLCGLTTKIANRCEPFWPVKYEQLYEKEEMLYPDLTPKDPWMWNILEMGVYVFGDNRFGQLGLGNNKNQSIPRRLSDRSFQINRTSVKIIQVSASSNHTVCLDENGNVWTFGSNRFGQLGLGYKSKQESKPQRINPCDFSVDKQLVRITRVSAGASHTVCLDHNKNVWTFGDNGRGQLGLGDPNDRNKPKRISGLPKITQVSAGSQHTVCLDDEKNVWTFGHNNKGQLGLGYVGGHSSTPQQIPEKLLPMEITQVSAGTAHTVCLDDDGNVWTFGDNQVGRLGLGRTFRIVATPRRISGLREIIQVSAGGDLTVSLDKNGNVWTFGYNHRGRLGLGPGFEQIVYTPQKINPAYFFTDEREVPITQVSAGVVHTVCLDKNGDVWTFGVNSSGQLGLGHRESQSTPKLMPYNKAVQVSAGGYYTMLIGF